MKLANVISTLEIGGETVRMGKLTIGAAIEIESHLADFPSPLDQLEKSGVLPQLPQDVAADLTSTAMQQSAFFPPDAIGAICDQRFLKRGAFGKAFLAAMIRAYNPHFEENEVERLAIKGTIDTIIAAQGIALGVNAADPKDEIGLGVATPLPNASNGAESSPG